MNVERVENCVCMLRRVPSASEHREGQIYSWRPSLAKYDSFLKYSIGYCMLIISQLLT